MHEIEIRTVNSTLRRNRTILRSLCPQGKSILRRESLVEMGFDFSKFTTIFPTSENIYFFCYEYGYMPITERSLTEGLIVQKVVIVRRQDFMNKQFNPWQLAFRSK